MVYDYCVDIFQESDFMSKMTRYTYKFNSDIRRSQPRNVVILYVLKFYVLNEFVFDCQDWT